MQEMLLRQPHIALKNQKVDYREITQVTSKKIMLSLKLLAAFQLCFSFTITYSLYSIYISQTRKFLNL